MGGEVITAISTVGFPIVACCYMLYINQQVSKEHKEEVGKLSEALNNNTLILSELKEMIRTMIADREENKDGD